jgi:hypothetical protein
MLVLALLEGVRGITSQVTVNAGAGSGPFWEALEFVPDVREGHTHMRNLIRSTINA